MVYLIILGVIAIGIGVYFFLNKKNTNDSNSDTNDSNNDSNSDTNDSNNDSNSDNNLKIPLRYSIEVISEDIPRAVMSMENLKLNNYNELIIGCPYIVWPKEKAKVYKFNYNDGVREFLRSKADKAYPNHNKYSHEALGHIWINNDHVNMPFESYGRGPILEHVQVNESGEILGHDASHFGGNTANNEFIDSVYNFASYDRIDWGYGKKDLRTGRQFLAFGNNQSGCIGELEDGELPSLICEYDGPGLNGGWDVWSNTIPGYPSNIICLPNGRMLVSTTYKGGVYFAYLEGRRWDGDRSERPLTGTERRSTAPLIPGYWEWAKHPEGHILNFGGWGQLHDLYYPESDLKDYLVLTMEDGLPWFSKITDPTNFAQCEIFKPLKDSDGNWDGISWRDGKSDYEIGNGNPDNKETHGYSYIVTNPKTKRPILVAGNMKTGNIGIYEINLIDNKITLFEVAWLGSFGAQWTIRGCSYNNELIFGTGKFVSGKKQEEVPGILFKVKVEE